MPVDRLAAAAAVDAFLRALGRDAGREPELTGTGARVADAYADALCAGYEVNVDRLLAESVIEGHTGLVVLRDVAIATTCPHHLLPATGTATIAFAPRGRIVGLGTLGQLLDAYAQRLALQEQIGESVVAALVTHLGPRWAGCRIVLSHGCMTMRGDRRHGARAETLALRGVEGDDAELAHRALGVGT